MTILTKTGRRLDNIVRYILDEYPQDKWVLSNIVSMFLEAIKSSTSVQEEQLIINKLNQLIASYEFRYNRIFETLKKIIKEIIQEDESLHKWFKRSGTPGKEGGWVDCNAPIRKDGKITGYKACGRKEGEKRSKYPSCRPTAAQCKDPGKGTKWGKTK
jgi:hypothetical protein